MPGLNIGIVSVEPNYEALIPTVKFKIQMMNATPVEPITGGFLDVDVYLVAEGKDKLLGKFTSILPISESSALNFRMIMLILLLRIVLSLYLEFQLFLEN